MLVPDCEFEQLRNSGDVVIYPFDSRLIQPASYDLRLGRSYARWMHNHLTAPLDISQDNSALLEKFEADEIVLQPGQKILATTLEHVTIGRRYAARIDGKSSVARNFVTVHAAGFVDPGFTGNLTLEIENNNDLPVLLKYGTPIAQLCVFRLTQRVLHPYGHKSYRSHYQGQEGATGPAPIALDEVTLP